MAKAKFTLIPVSEIKKAPRGRTAETDPELLDALSQVEAGMAISLEGFFGNVAKDDRQKVSQRVRTHWEQVQEGKPSLNYSPEGVLQVSHSTRDDETVSA